jgi:hypothetical protein
MMEEEEVKEEEFIWHLSTPIATAVTVAAGYDPRRCKLMT